MNPPVHPVPFSHPQRPHPMKHTTFTPPSVLPWWRQTVSAAVLALAVGAGAHAARAADFNPPDRLTYQGYLADANGNPLATNNPVNYDVVFRVYPEQNGGAVLWAEKQTVTVDHGQFSVLLGEGSQHASEPRDPLNTVFASPTASDRYLELTVTLNGSPLTIAPRLRLVTSPYAFHARTATAVVSPNGAKLVTGANGALTVSGAVNATSFAGNGAGVTAINAGNITTGVLANARTTATEQNVANAIMMRNGNGDTVVNGLYANYLHSYGSANVGGVLSAGWINSDQPRFRGINRETGIGGAYVQWGNRAPGSYGQTYVLNQREGGNWGIFLGELDNNGAGGISPSLFTAPDRTTVYGGLYANGRVFSGSAGSGGIWVDGGSQQFVGSVNASQMGLYNGSAWRMVVDSNGNIGMGTTGPGARLDVAGTVRGYGFSCREAYAGLLNLPNSGEHTFNFHWSGLNMAAYIDSSFVGWVGGTSDRRLKEAIEPMPAGALARVLALKPASFKYRDIADSIFKGDGQTKEGFIADELQQVVPSAVTGEKDALTSDGKIQPQVINLAPVVALLTKAMQEQQQQVAELEQKATRVEALERQVADLKELVNRLVVMREAGSSDVNTTAANGVSGGQP